MPAGLTNLIQYQQHKTDPIRALRVCMRKPSWCSVKKLHEEANIPAVRDFQNRLANEFLKRAKEDKIESILELIQKKNNVQKTVIKAYWTISPSNLLYQLLYRRKARTTIIQ